MMRYEPVVNDLIDLIHMHHWESKFQQAVDHAHASGVVEMQNMKTTRNYMDFINGLLRWVASEDLEGVDILNRMNAFHFVLAQSPMCELQNAIAPAPKAQPLTPLSAWMVRYASAVGAFLDSPESITDTSISSFLTSPNYNMGEYLEPRGGWCTFNALFARNFKPGYRPVAAVADASVIVSAADSTFAGQGEIRKDALVTAKDLHWRIGEIMEGSPYQSRFDSGQFMHAFLSPTDYHRLHAPMGGKVLEARVIPGQVYLQVVVEAVGDPVADDGAGRLRLRAVQSSGAVGGAGYPFAQARGLVVLDTPIGLIAVLPIGMSQVSSVVMTAEVGVSLRKGEELAYFQFGGSDIVVLFEASSNVSFTAQPGVHYKMGTRIAEAFPVI